VSAAAVKPKRLSLSEILHLVLTRQVSEPSAVTLTRNASGETVIEVKVKAHEDGGLAAVDEAAEHAARLYDDLRVAYPAGEGADDGVVKLTRNAKGETQIDVEIKTDMRSEALSIEQAASKAETTYERLRRQYPLADGTATKDRP
jgi:hypothetical protein